VADERAVAGLGDPQEEEHEPQRPGVGMGPFEG
jgi:hypothetical protein